MELDGISILVSDVNFTRLLKRQSDSQAYEFHKTLHNPLLVK